VHPNEDFAWDRTLELLGLQWGQSLGEGSSKDSTSSRRRSHSARRINVTVCWIYLPQVDASGFSGQVEGISNSAS
jgi:hypothetical protein